MKMTFTVDRQSIRRTDDFTVVGDSVQYLQAQFTFLGDWDENHIILPIFERGTRVYIPKLLKSGKYLDDGNTCLIPHEALVGEGVMYVSLLDETDGVRITTNKAAVCIEQSGYTAKVEESLTPTPTVYDEILRLYGELKNMIAVLPTAPDGLKLESNLLQLTAKGEAVGTGVQLPAIPPPQATYTVTSVDCKKYWDTTAAYDGKWANVINHFVSTIGSSVSVGIWLLKGFSETADGVHTTTTVLSGLPEILYTDDGKTLNPNDTIKIVFRFDGNLTMSLDDFVQMMREGAESGESTVDILNMSGVVTDYICIDLKFTFSSTADAKTFAESVEGEIFPILDSIQIYTDRKNYTEQESEVVYDGE